MHLVQCCQGGCLMVDGVVTKLGGNSCYFSTSSARAGETIARFRYWSREKNWDYEIIILTNATGSINIAGPKSREVLQKLTDVDISNEVLPYLGYKEICCSFLR